MTKSIGVRGWAGLLAPFLLLLALALGASHAFAQQDSISVTITPPKIDLSISPGESWSTNLKVVNNNGADVTYYTEIMNFEAQGEAGTGKMTPIVNESPSERAVSLAGWIDMSPDPITIPAHASGQIPFTVHVPQNAEPGGHYAAILVGTQPVKPNGNGGAVVGVSSYVSSLIFVKVKGDVVEKGRIREFTTDKDLYQTPEAKFLVRFENIGNTHLLPRGNISIFNMWGQRRGTVAINDDNSDFGNVLPKSIRRFEFVWKGEDSPFDIGRYSAVVTLAFGDEDKQNISAVTYFWVVPVVPVAGTLGATILFITLITWFIRRYIRRALLLERQKYHLDLPHIVPPQAQVNQVPMMKVLVEPLKESVVDLRSIGKSYDALRHKPGSITQPVEPLTTGEFVSRYKIFFLFILVLFAGVVGGTWYWHKATVESRSFQITNISIHEEKVPQ